MDIIIVSPGGTGGPYSLMCLWVWRFRGWKELIGAWKVNFWAPSEFSNTYSMQYFAIYVNKIH